MNIPSVKWFDPVSYMSRRMIDTHIKEGNLNPLVARVHVASVVDELDELVDPLRFTPVVDDGTARTPDEEEIFQAKVKARRAAYDSTREFIRMLWSHPDKIVGLKKYSEKNIKQATENAQMIFHYCGNGSDRTEPITTNQFNFSAGEGS